MASSAKRLLIPQKTSQSLQEINRLRAAAGVRPAGQDWSRYVRMISSLRRKRAMGETPRHKSKPKGGAMTIRRRTVLKGMLAASALVAAPAILRAQSGPMKIGFLTVKTGPLASGGIQMEQGLTLYLKERNNMLAGRAVQLSHGRLRGQGIQIQARRHDRRRHRLWLRAQRRLPARLRGRRRQGGAEALAAAGLARLRHLYRAAQAGRRRPFHRLRRLQRI